MNGTWYQDKLQRSIRFYRTFCIPTCTCAACSGSGVYDHGGSPACGACEGSGRVRDYPRSAHEAADLMKDPTLREATRRRRVQERREMREQVMAHAHVTAR
jgi:hypothetical protein